MNELYRWSARELIQHLKDGSISSEEATRVLLARIERVNPTLNAVVTLDAERALRDARAADQERAQGKLRGPLHGLPMTLKDTWEVTGMRTTAGAPSLSGHIPARDADLVARLRAAGVIILGKTNVPYFASDVQTYNRIFGVTHNPWSRQHTCGGSSGGAAAALACGMTPLELGSDVGGSIRTPAHYCGVFGHKPTRDILSMRGHIPGPPGTRGQPDLAEAGPMARHVDDLELLLDCLIGAKPVDSTCWQVHLPEPRFSRLDEARIGFWFEDPHAPLDPNLLGAYTTLVETLQAQGAQTARARHPVLCMETLLPVYYNLLGSLMSPGLKTQQRLQMQVLGTLGRHLGSWVGMTPGLDEYAASMAQPHYRWMRFNEQRERLREKVVELFRDVDVLLMPVTPTTAIPHDHSEPLFRRTIRVNGRKRPYMDQFSWITLATTLGLPATVAPIGHDAQGLPFGIQIVGAPGHDRTTLQLARLLEQHGLAGTRLAQA